MLSDGAVRELLDLVAQGTPLYRAAQRVGTTEKTARRYVRARRLPSEMKTERTYRTREDPFERVWPQVAAMLEDAPELEAKTIFDYLTTEKLGEWQEGQLRTLQRRVHDWRVRHGPEKEIYFPQVHRPGRQGQSDFTSMIELGITIAGEPFPHLLYHFVLPYSNWEYAEIAFSESFAALSQGVQNALWTLGLRPEEHRTDNLSAATHDLHEEAGRAFNTRYLALVDHYGMEPSTNTPGKGHENGDVEKAHDLLKRAMRQHLALRRSRDFASRDAYEQFMRDVVARRNALRSERFAEERLTLQPLPSRRLADHEERTIRVRSTSTILVLQNVYSVPSRLIGEEVNVRIGAEELEVRHGSQVVERMPRMHGTKLVRINYRHMIRWLVKKPGAFENYRYRDELFPTVTFRRAFDLLRSKLPGSATLEYLRVLKLAAETMESEVDAALGMILEAGGTPTSKAVEDLVAPRPPKCPEVDVREPDVKRYDELLLAEEAA